MPTQTTAPTTGGTGVTAPTAPTALPKSPLSSDQIASIRSGNVPTSTASAPTFDPNMTGEQYAAQLKGQLTPKSSTGSDIISDYGNSVAGAFKGGVGQIEQGATEVKSGGANPLTGIEGGLTGSSGLASMITSPIAPLFKPLADAINFAGDKISNIKSVQNFAQTPIGKIVARATQDISNAANVAGTVAGMAGGADAVTPLSVEDRVQAFADKPEDTTLYSGENPTNAGHSAFTDDKGYATTMAGENGSTLEGNLPSGSNVKILNDDDLEEARQAGAQSSADVNQHFFDQGHDALVRLDNGKMQVDVNPDLRGRFSAPDTTTDSFDDNIQEAKNILNPSGKLSAGAKGSALDAGTVSVEGKGPFAREVVTPDTTPMHETLAQMVDDGKISEKNWPHQNIDAMGTEARVHDANIDELIDRQNLNVPIDKDEIVQALEDAKQKGIASREFVSGSTASKAYEDMFDIAKDKITNARSADATDLGDFSIEPENQTDVRGLRDATKAFNGRSQDLLGKQIYGPSDDGVGNARVQAAKEARGVLNDLTASKLEDASDNAGTGSLFKSELQKEAQILSARDELIKNSRGDVGRTAAELYLNKNPAVKFTARLGQRILWRTAAGLATRGIIGGLKGIASKI